MDAEVFVYMGEGGARVPDDAVRARVDPSITSISARAFFQRKKLAEVELCEGLVAIGVDSFARCDHSIMKIIIPNSLRRIRDKAFYCSLRCPIRLHDGIESIGEYAFARCIFTNFRVPPLITVIPECMLSNCRATFSLELPETVSGIENYALQDTVYEMWLFRPMLTSTITSLVEILKRHIFSSCLVIRMQELYERCSIDLMNYISTN
jgi:hypothetical protein